MASERRQVVADADVLMNLLGSGAAAEILQSLDVIFLAPPTVCGESIYLESLLPGGEREKIDLSALVDAGVLIRIDLDDAELDLVVDLARIVDDGEAEVIAVALIRNLSMATDDRKARRTASDRGIANLLSTPELIHAWSEASRPGNDRLSKVTRSISRRTRYRPPHSHPLHGWWMSYLEGLTR